MPSFVAFFTVFIYIKIQLCKQTTTNADGGNRHHILYLSISRYNFASKPQHLMTLSHSEGNCIYLYQDTTLQANHNLEAYNTFFNGTVFIYIKIQLCKQTTTIDFLVLQVWELYLSISRYNFASKPQLLCKGSGSQ